MILTSIVAVNLIFPVTLFVRAMPRWWLGMLGEDSPINGFSSVQCAILALTATALFLVTRQGRAAGSDSIRRAWPWLVGAVGFLFLSMDELFEFHERAPRAIFKPLGLLIDIPGIKTGDLLLPLLALAGVGLTWFLLDDLRRQRRSLIPFLVALALGFLLALLDVSSSSIFKQGAARHVQIVAEETGEIWTQALFGIAMVTLLFRKLRALSIAGGGPRAPRADS